VDGPGDMGIDAWYLASDRSPKVLYLVQSKDTRADRNDLHKLRNGFVDLFNPALSVNANNEVRVRASELAQELDEQMVIEFHLVTSELASRGLRMEGEPL
jgi:hypothetical protein